MTDTTSPIDQERIARLRNPKRLETVHPDQVWQVLTPPEQGTIVDIGAGVGYLTLPMARRFPKAGIVACDILPGMLHLLEESLREEGLGNVRTVVMEPTRVPLPDGSADLVTMLQVHHELSDPPALLKDCQRLLRPGGMVAIIDWKVELDESKETGSRRVPEQTIRDQLSAAGFADITTHDTYERHNFITAVR